VSITLLSLGNDQQGDPMIDVRMMPLPTTLTESNFDVAIIVGNQCVVVSN